MYVFHCDKAKRETERQFFLLTTEQPKPTSGNMQDCRYVPKSNCSRAVTVRLLISMPLKPDVQTNTHQVSNSVKLVRELVIVHVLGRPFATEDSSMLYWGISAMKSVIRV
jgi:hypothetical protein